MQPPNNNQPDIELTKTGIEDKQTMENLLSLYLHEFTQYNPFLTISEDGLYRYSDDIGFFWNGNFYPYLIKVEGKIAGFVILMADTPEVPEDCDYDMCEFFILWPYRRKGIGGAAIDQVFQLHPGRYHVVELTDNMPAIDFWHSFYRSRGIEYEEKEKYFGDLKGIYQKFRT